MTPLNQSIKDLFTYVLESKICLKARGRALANEVIWVPSLNEPDLPNYMLLDLAHLSKGKINNMRKKYCDRGNVRYYHEQQWIVDKERLAILQPDTWHNEFTNEDCNVTLTRVVFCTDDLGRLLVKSCRFKIMGMRDGQPIVFK